MYLSVRMVPKPPLWPALPRAPGRIAVRADDPDERIASRMIE